MIAPKHFGWNSDYGNYVALGRLKPGTSIAQATENLNVISDDIARQIPPDKLDGPSALALVNRKLYVLNMSSNHISVLDL